MGDVVVLIVADVLIWCANSKRFHDRITDDVLLIEKACVTVFVVAATFLGVRAHVLSVDSIRQRHVIVDLVVGFVG